MRSIKAVNRILVNATLILAMMGPAVAGDIIVGQAVPIDGDGFAIGDAVIRLADIDAPELAQTCEDGPKPLRRCGEHVAGLLASRIRGQLVRCSVQGLDRYDRHLARCTHSDEDLSTWLVKEGWALAYRGYSDRLISVEAQAKAQGKGIWATRFEAPWDFRARRWEVAKQQAPAGCPIKGNITRDGTHIYHTPWSSRWYERTKVSVDEGERWFCSEREALDAGWREPRR